MAARLAGRLRIVSWADNTYLLGRQCLTKALALPHHRVELCEAFFSTLPANDEGR